MKDGQRPDLPPDTIVECMDATTGWTSSPPHQEVQHWAWSGIAHKITHWRLAEKPLAAQWRSCSHAPSKEGVYRRRIGAMEGFAYWTGKFWGLQDSTERLASEFLNAFSKSAYQDGEYLDAQEADDQGAATACPLAGTMARSGSDPKAGECNGPRTGLAASAGTNQPAMQPAAHPDYSKITAQLSGQPVRRFGSRDDA